MDQVEIDAEAIIQAVRGNGGPAGFYEEMKVDIVFEILTSLVNENEDSAVNCLKAAMELIPGAFNELSQVFSSAIALEMISRKIIKYILNPSISKKRVGYIAMSALLDAEQFDNIVDMNFLGLVCMGLEHADLKVRIVAELVFAQFATILNPKSREIKEIYMNTGLQRLRDENESLRLKVSIISAIADAIDSFYVKLKVKLPLSIVEELLEHFFDISSKVENLERDFLATAKIILFLPSVSPDDFVFPERLVEFLKKVIKTGSEKSTAMSSACLTGIAISLEFDRMKAHIPELLESFKVYLSSSSNSMKSKELVFASIDTLLGTYKEHMDVFFLNMIELFYSLFDVSRCDENDNQGEAEEEAPENLILGERTSSENIRFQEAIKVQEDLEEKKKAEKEASIELQKRCFSTIGYVLQIISPKCMLENMETIERLVIDLEKKTLEENALKLLFSSLQGVIFNLKIELKDSVNEEDYKEAFQLVPKLLSLMENMDDLKSALEACTLIIDLLKRFDAKKIGEFLLVLKAQEIFISLIIECRKINNDDKSKTAYYKRQLLYRTRDIMIAFSKQFGPDFAPSLKDIYEKSLPYFPTKFEDNECVFNVIIGLIADVAEHIQLEIIPFGKSFIPMFARYLEDSCAGVRHNASFGLGTMFASAKGAFKEYYDLVLPSLYKVAQVSSDDTDLLGARDNALSALAKMIAADPENLPVAGIASKVLDGLPLLEDFAENEDIYPALISVFEKTPSTIEEVGESIMLKFIPAMLDNENVPSHTREMISEFLKKHFSISLGYRSRLDSNVSSNVDKNMFDNSYIIQMLKGIPQIEKIRDQLGACSTLLGILSENEEIIELNEDLLLTTEDVFVSFLDKISHVDNEDNSEEAELMNELLEDFIDIFLILSRRFGSTFAPTLKSIFDKSEPYLSNHAHISDVINRLFSSSLAYLGSAMIPFGHTFIPRFIQLLDSHHANIQQTASCGLGNVFAAAKGAFKEYYHLVLPRLYKLAEISDEDSEFLSVRDNAVSALAKMIAADSSNLPLAEIVPMILNGLLLEKEHAENEHIYPALIFVFQQYPQLFVENDDDIMMTFMLAGQDKQNISDKTREKIMKFMDSQNL
jgi:hypothetical protein